MPDVAGPRHVRDVQEPVHAGLELDERAEVREVAHLALHALAGLVALVDGRPRIGLHLLHAQGDPLGRLVHVQHQDIDHVADVDDLRRVPDPPRPRHLGDVDEPLDPRLELDEGAVVREADDPPLDLGPHGEARVHDGPRIRGLLLVAQRHAPRLAVEVQDDHLDLVADLEDLGGVAHPPPGHVRHVEEAVDAAQVDEGAVVRDVLDGARQDHALREDGEGVLPLLLALLLEDGAAREHDVAAAPVELDDLGADDLPEHGGQVLHGPEVDLRAGEERAHPDVDGEAALDDLHHLPLHRRAAVMGLGDGVPHLDLVGLVLGEDDQSFAVLLGLEVDLDLLAHLRERARVAELLDGDGPLALVADVHEDLAIAYLDHPAADDLPFLDVAHSPLEPILHALLGAVVHLPLPPCEALRLPILRLHNAVLPPLMDIAGAAATGRP